MPVPGQVQEDESTEESVSQPQEAAAAVAVAEQQQQQCDYDPDRAESWTHELEHTFETMECAEEVQRLLEVFHGKYFPNYARRERRDQFHELVQGDLTVAQYRQRFFRLLRHVPHASGSKQACEVYCRTKVRLLSSGRARVGRRRRDDSHRPRS
ncbi:hypothetical protein Taro_040216 [Colocasia esculenta]|uniref:Retrotransposon gag domain-containing protein n=1 Tax=Colocasia esculenta TaxID=4460 RepID=A0A843WCL8_COLES|nr:hypothetical protein [Colocasia esculenta]